MKSGLLVRTAVDDVLAAAQDGDGKSPTLQMFAQELAQFEFVFDNQAFATIQAPLTSRGA